MKDSQAQLTSVLKAAQMGQVGIECIQDAAVPISLQSELSSQLQEYQSIEQQALAIAARREWQLPSLSPMIRPMCRFSARMRLRQGHTSSQIAGMMIQGNTRGMITSIKNLRQFRSSDLPVQQLSQKLLETETSNIQNMKKFL